MGSLAFVMALMGCADGGSGCTEVRLSDYSFKDRAQCEQAVELVLNRSTDIDYPSISARCMTAQQYASSRDASRARTALANLQEFRN